MSQNSDDEADKSRDDGRDHDPSGAQGRNPEDGQDYCPDDELDRNPVDGHSQEIHHNFIIGPAAIGGSQYLSVPAPAPLPAPLPQQPSLPSQAWGVIVAAWALSPLMAWATYQFHRGPLKVLDILSSVTPYVLLAGGIAVCLDVAGYVSYRRWAVIQRAVTHPMTWKLRLGMALVGGIGLGAVMFASRGA